MAALTTLPAIELARRIRDGELTARQAVAAHIARAEAVHGRIHAIVADRFEDALAEADAADARQAAGEALGPLHGVPCTIKEAFAVRGMPNTGGLLARKGTVADADAVAVRRLREAGAIVLGVTNLSELCMWMESDNPVYGRTGNPYDPRRSAGGSSGGEGAIVGSGASPFGLGSDVGGSIRLPSFFNGVFGHKASPGLIPNVGQFPIGEEASLALLATGPLTRSSEDLWPLIRILAGPDPADPFASAQPLGDPDDVVLEAMRIATVGSNGRTRPSKAIRQAQARAAAHLGTSGAEVHEVALPELKDDFAVWSQAMHDANGSGSFRRMMGRERRRDLLPHLLRPSELGGVHTLPATILGLVEDAVALSPTTARRMRALKGELRQRVLDVIGDGVMLYPTYPVTARKHRRSWFTPHYAAYCGLFNALGLPSTAVPLGLDRSGLPTGIQVVGAPGADHVTVAIARALERGGVAGWTAPPI